VDVRARLGRDAEPYLDTMVKVGRFVPNRRDGNG